MAYAWLSIGAAVATIGLKTLAYWLTGSVGLLSDALESLVNLAAAIIALLMIRLAARPPDEDHAFGYSKAEYFASGVEGALIFVAAAAIAVTAVRRLLSPTPLEQLGLGMAVSLLATLINLAVGVGLVRAGHRHNSIALEADGRHLLTDVWTSAGVLVGLLAVTVTGWLRLDPVIALAVAANILWTGYRLLARSARGLLDQALPAGDREAIAQVLARYEARSIRFHALRTRQAAGQSFISVHVLVPGAWTVQRGHELLEEIERDLRTTIPGAAVFTHLEPVEDPVSMQDAELHRP
ncbi:MAG TPA: cation diffusion facilitator family transporter [Burkholderiales bacterium]|nr:cation diffusion facilitator family transporter [Burkholderiales bacterium]